MRELDFEKVRAAYLGNLQLTQDYLRACEAGLHNLTESAYEATIPRGWSIPAPERRLSFEAAREHAFFALARTYIRDVVDFLGHYLDGTYDRCAFVEAIVRHERPIDTKALQEGLGNYRRSGFPAKLQILRERFGVFSSYEPHVLSINRIRNCLVHRLGRVEPDDLLQGEERLRLRMVQLTISVPAGARQTGIWKAAEIPKEKVIVEEVGKSFALREHLRFNSQDLRACGATMYAFDESMRSTVVDFCRRSGISVTGELGSQLPEPRAPNSN